jgi:hypothetical protein
MNNKPESMKCDCGGEMKYLSPIFEARGVKVLGDNYICKKCFKVEPKYFKKSS